MKKLLTKLIVLAGLSVALVGSALAGGSSYNGGGNWNLSVPSVASFSTSLSATNPGGNAVAYVINSALGLVYQVHASNPGNPLASGSASNQPAGSYQIVHVVQNGAGASTTVSW